MHFTIASGPFAGHRLVVDSASQTVALENENGTVLAESSWEEVIREGLHYRDHKFGEFKPEKRGYVRVPLAAAVKCRGKALQITSVTCNVSGGGLFLEVVDPPPLGTVLDLHISVPMVGEVQTRGEVVWVGEGVKRLSNRGIGIRFTDINETDRTRVLDALSAILLQRA